MQYDYPEHLTYDERLARYRKQSGRRILGAFICVVSALVLLTWYVS